MVGSEWSDVLITSFEASSTDWSSATPRNGEKNCLWLRFPSVGDDGDWVDGGRGKIEKWRAGIQGGDEHGGGVLVRVIITDLLT